MQLAVSAVGVVWWSSLMAGCAQARAPAPRRFRALRAPADPIEPPEHPDHNNTNFCPMPVMQQQGATLVEDADLYPWAARVIHTYWTEYSKTSIPMICTAFGIQYRIYITAARCVYAAKPAHMHLRFGKSSTKVSVKACVTPRHSTKQLFDDIGIIVTWISIPGGEAAPWGPYLSQPSKPRTGESYWFQDWVSYDNYKVIGYIAEEKSRENHSLYVLDDMYGSNSVCNQHVPAQKGSQDYWAACVHSCQPHQHSSKRPPCLRYLLGLGHAVLDDKNELVGIVTWSCGNEPTALARRGGLPLPLGVAVPDDRYQQNLKCAEKVRDNLRDASLYYPGFLQSLCPPPNKVD
ncbi:uncharacterized protein LOC125241789 isoform X1 [Leguminivora glycinivorella]|uniref:uncharacterized protein LOC125241789 isoform X1 n=2 Tax=Leguminivora glycinivorella TaxID=1035111 RepID=UPI00200DB3BA|nr:uncharacterized protein LOC125241789 isoform X1 [Leguminivora glycinivorella]